MLGTTQHLSRWCHQPIMWISVIGFLWLASSSQAAIIFQDNFEYVVDRNVTNAEVPFRARGWSDAKATNAQRNSAAYGYLYTTEPSGWSSRALVMQSLAETFNAIQTDYWLKYGSESHPLGTIPANVWFQFWTYAVPGGRWDSQSKFLYPCHTYYPCPNDSFQWLFLTSDRKINPPGDNVIVAPNGGRYFELRSAYANFTGGPSWNAQKLFQNVSAMYLAEGVWYQVRIHLDTSGPQGVYELWVRERGVSTWTKLAEWIGGVTPNFNWPIPQTARAGNRQLAMPTTVNAYNSTIYMDDFIMATSVNDLDGTSSSTTTTDTTPPSPPQNTRIVP